MRKHIVIAEDEVPMRSFLARMLEGAGYHVTQVGNGVDALRAVKSMPTDLLLTDIVMPGADGLEVARWALQENPNLQVLFISDFALSAREESDYPSDRTRIVAKPFSLTDLVSEVNTIFGTPATTARRA